MTHAQHGWTAGVAARARRYWRAQLRAAGELPCLRCGLPVYPGYAWDVDHVKPLSRGGSIGLGNQGVSHRRCNRRHGQALAAAGRKAAAATMRPGGPARGIRRW